MKKLGIVFFLSVLTFIILNISFTKYLGGKFAYCNNSDYNLLISSSVSCGEWNLQQNGCYERVCCCDQNGYFWCERCCPDSSGKCTPYKVNC